MNPPRIHRQIAVVHASGCQGQWIIISGTSEDAARNANQSPPPSLGIRHRPKTAPAGYQCHHPLAATRAQRPARSWRQIPRADTDALSTIQTEASFAPCRRAAPRLRPHVASTLPAECDGAVRHKQGCSIRVGVFGFFKAPEAAKNSAGRSLCTGARALVAAAGTASTDQLRLRIEADMASVVQVPKACKG